jgi:hypothetical protein
MRPRNKWRAQLAAAVVVCWLAGNAAAEDRREWEESLFNDAAGSTADAAAALPAPELLAPPEPKTVGFSGTVTSAIVNQVSNTQAANALYTFTVAEVFLDARLPQNAKVFADLEAIYLSQNQVTQVALQELFFDFNLFQSVYFRTGKQVLQWGRCYLWNPTDLINVERPHFVPKIGTREGAYGLKMHLPFGTRANLYGFVDTGAALDAEHTAGAFKAEILLWNFEAAFSGWGKKGFYPVWGLDFSTRIVGIDTMGEISLSRGDHQARARIEDGRLTVATGEESWAPRASLDLSRSFTVGDFKDRLTVMVEGYYDRAGYTDNVLADPAQYDFAPETFDGPTPVTRGTQKDFITFNHLYQPNYFSRAYVALFTTFNRFLLTDMTLSGNAILNLVDSSGLLSLGVNYSALNSFTAGLLANFDLGAPDREYTFSGEKLNLQLTFGISF